MSDTTDDAFRDILDYCTGFHRPMVVGERLRSIQNIAEAALNDPGKRLNEKAVRAFDLAFKARHTKDKDQAESLHRQAREVWSVA